MSPLEIPLMLMVGLYEVLTVGVVIVFVKTADPFGRPFASEAYIPIWRVSPGDEDPVLNCNPDNVPLAGMMTGKKCKSVVTLFGTQLEATVVVPDWPEAING